MPIIIRPSKIPGRMLASKRSAIEKDAVTPYNTRGTLGGITGQIKDAAKVTAREKSSSQTPSLMDFSSMAPRPPVSAMALPLMPAKITLAKTLACAKPPRKCPTRCSAKEWSYVKI